MNPVKAPMQKKSHTFEERVTRAFYQHEQLNPPDAKEELYVVRRAVFEQRFFVAAAPIVSVHSLIDDKRPIKPAFTVAMDTDLVKFAEEHAGERIPWQELLATDPRFEHFTATDLRSRCRNVIQRQAKTWLPDY